MKSTTLLWAVIWGLSILVIGLVAHIYEITPESVKTKSLQVKAPTGVMVPGFSMEKFNLMYEHVECAAYRRRDLPAVTSAKLNAKTKASLDKLKVEEKRIQLVVEAHLTAADQLQPPVRGDTTSWRSWKWMKEGEYNSSSSVYQADLNTIWNRKCAQLLADHNYQVTQ